MCMVVVDANPKSESPQFSTEACLEKCTSTSTGSSPHCLWKVRLMQQPHLGLLTGSDSESEGSGAEYDGKDEIEAAKPKRDDWMTANDSSGRNILTGEIHTGSKRPSEPDKEQAPTHKVCY